MITIKFNIIRKIIAVLAIMVLLSPGCSEDYLLENPKTSLSEGIFWQSKDEAHQALMGC